MKKAPARSRRLPSTRTVYPLTTKGQTPAQDLNLYSNYTV